MRKQILKEIAVGILAILVFTFLSTLTANYIAEWFIDAGYILTTLIYILTFVIFYFLGIVLLILID